MSHAQEIATSKLSAGCSRITKSAYTTSASGIIVDCSLKTTTTTTTTIIPLAVVGYEMHR